jgi:hypothetical protein
VIKSPISGVAIYGEHERGRWGNTAELARRLRVNGTCKPETVLITVVGRQPLRILGSVDENDLRHVAVGRDCQVKPLAFPDAELTGTVVELAKYPTGAKQYWLELSVTIPDDLPIVPGMNCHLIFEKESPAEPDSEQRADSDTKANGSDGTE